MNFLRFEDVSYCFDKKAPRKNLFKDINLALKSGDTAAITGKSGCGKSTILALLGGMMPVTSGTYYFSNQKLDNSSQSNLARFRKSEVGFIFQRPHLLPHLRILENIMLPVEGLSKATREAARERTEILLCETGIQDLAKRYPSEISGGQAQRAAFVRALIRKPSLILADEPTANIDEKTGELLVERLIIEAQAGAIVVLVTHQEEFANRMKQKFTLFDGKLSSDVFNEKMA